MRQRRGRQSRSSGCRAGGERRRSTLQPSRPGRQRAALQKGRRACYAAARAVVEGGAANAGAPTGKGDARVTLLQGSGRVNPLHVAVYGPNVEIGVHFKCKVHADATRRATVSLLKSACTLSVKCTPMLQDGRPFRCLHSNGLQISLLPGQV